MQLNDRLITKPTTKHEIKSINKTLFMDIIPSYLRVWLEPLPPTVMMQELKQFQKYFKNCSEDQQLLIISQMISFRPSVEANDCNIHVYRSIHASNFLINWEKDIRKMESSRNIMCRYQRYADQLVYLIDQLSIDSICNLMLKIIQTLQCSIMDHMKVFYGNITDDEMYDLIYNTHSIQPLAKRAIIIADMCKASCPITRQIMVLHLQLERQMILHLQQRKDQLNQRIEMQLELEKLIQYEIKYLQEQ